MERARRAMVWVGGESSAYKGSEVREYNYVQASSKVIRGSRGKAECERVTADGDTGELGLNRVRSF